MPFRFRFWINWHPFAIHIGKREYIGGCLAITLKWREPPILFLYYDGQTMWRGWTMRGFYKWLNENSAYVNLNRVPAPWLESTKMQFWGRLVSTGYFENRPRVVWRR